MSNIIPFKLKSGATAKGMGKLNIGNLLSSNSNLLPILFIFMSGKKGANLEKLNNLFQLNDGFRSLTSKLNLSSQDIAKNLEILSALGPLGISNNLATISKISSVLNGIQKINNIKQNSRNLGDNSNDDTAGISRKHGLTANISIIEAVEDLLGPNMKTPISKAKNMLGMYNKFRTVTETFNEKKKKKEKLDISDMFGIVKPILNENQSKTLDGMENMLSMMNLMSSLNAMELMSTEENDNIETKTSKPKNGIDIKSIFSIINMMSSLGINPLVGGKGNTLDPSNIFSIMNKLNGKNRKIDKDKVIEISQYDEIDDFDDEDEIEKSL